MRFFVAWSGAHRLGDVLLRRGDEIDPLSSSKRSLRVQTSCTMATRNPPLQNLDAFLIIQRNSQPYCLSLDDFEIARVR
jgi:hypothetical protein